jgi:hypothetical protein
LGQARGEKQEYKKTGIHEYKMQGIGRRRDLRFEISEQNGTTDFTDYTDKGGNINSKAETGIPLSRE